MTTDKKRNNQQKKMSNKTLMTGNISDVALAQRDFSVFEMSLLFGSLVILVGTCGNFAGASSCHEHLLPELTYSLSGRNLDWPSQRIRKDFEVSGRYVARNIVPTRVQIFGDRAILALPRYKTGVPFSLGVVSLGEADCTPNIRPFPCWDIQEEGNPAALQNVVDLALDLQNILWVLDVGVVNTLGQPVRRAEPKVVGIDVVTGKVSYH